MLANKDFLFKNILQIYHSFIFLLNWLFVKNKWTMNVRDNLIERYFFEGHHYSEIVRFLENYHGVVTSVGTIKQIFRQKDLRQRLPATEIVDAMKQELSGNGSLIGYCGIHQMMIENCFRSVENQFVAA